MKYVALLSGGKDSCYNLLHCERNGHELTAAASLGPQSGKEELDSYLYQTVGQDVIDLVAEALDVPLYRQTITGTAVNQGSEYGCREAAGSLNIISGDETEDLFELLKQVKNQHPEIRGVSVGAILSNYQRVRVEHVCLRLSLTPLCFLWQRDQDELLSEMIDTGMNAILIKVAGIGLTPKHLEKSLVEMQPLLRHLNSLYGAHICGEGGEYETLTLDCPMFKKRIVLEELETVIHSDSAFATVAYLRIKKASLQAKNLGVHQSVPIPSLLFYGYSATENAISTIMKEQSKERYGGIPTTALDTVSVSHTKVGRWVAVSNVQKPHDAKDVTMEEEVNLCFVVLKDILANYNLTLSHLANISIFISNMADFAIINSAYKTFFGTSPPTRACVALDLPAGVGVRLDCIASEEQSQSERRALHVQSLSYWAPANIGPYSQAIAIGNRVFISGQIGMQPSTLSLPEPPNFSLEAALSFQHAYRILSTVEEMYGVNNWTTYIQCMICWLTDDAFVHVMQKINDTLPSSRSSAIPTLIIGAKTLPKNAQIEVQVVAHTGLCTVIDDGEAEIRQCTPTFNSGELETGECSVYWEVSAFAEDGAFSGFLAVKGSILGVVEDTRARIGLHIIWSQTFSVRLFYTGSHADACYQISVHGAETLIACVKALFSLGKCPAITVIPTRFIAARVAADYDYALCFIGSL